MKEPGLDAYREALGELLFDGAHVGYLATQVEPMRAGFLLRRQERVWLLVTLLDGSLDIQEDYPPWSYVADLRDGHLCWAFPGAPEVDYEVRWLQELEKRSAWPRFGIVEQVGAYMRRRRQR